MNAWEPWEKPWGESYPYFITSNNYFYIPFTAGKGELAADCCYFIKSAAEGNVAANRQIFVIAEWTTLRLHTLSSKTEVMQSKLRDIKDGNPLISVS